MNKEQYELYDFIATGIVTNVRETKTARYIYLKVESLYKGKEKKDTIQIISAKTQGECGIFPENGEKWLMFAFKRNNLLHTDLCTRTKNMNPNAMGYNKDEIGEDITYLKYYRHTSTFLFIALLLTTGFLWVFWWKRKKNSR